MSQVDMSLLSIKTSLKRAFDAQASIPSDVRGYVQRPEDNLIPGVSLDDLRADYDSGAGNELQDKFKAVHSSSALVANAFGPFKARPGDLRLLATGEYGAPVFEKTLPTGLHGTPPHLDVFLRRADEALAIESKFLEYFTPKAAVFSASYSVDSLPRVEACWWRVVEMAKVSGERHLDVAQLAKHYFGISRLLEHGDQTGWHPSSATLLYLFWEPLDAEHVEACLVHRREIEELAAIVAPSRVNFRFLNYASLFAAWSSEPCLVEHASRLQRRYSVEAASS